MNKKLVLAIAMISFLVPTLSVSSKAQITEITGTIYINADGSISPSTALIHSADNITYTLAGNITANADGIVIERDNIVLDGASYSIQGEGSGNGTDLPGRNNVTIQNTNVENFTTGIMLSYCSGCTVTGNNATNDLYGILILFSNGNTISANTVSGKYSTELPPGTRAGQNYDYGIALESSSGNKVSGNNAANNAFGILLDSSLESTISGNNMTNNGVGIEIDYSSDSNNVSGNSLTGNGAGIMLDYSSGNTLRNNVMADNTGNFGLDGNSLSDFVNDVDDSNTVDGKPIYYWINMQSATVPCRPLGCS